MESKQNPKKITLGSVLTWS